MPVQSARRTQARSCGRWMSSSGRTSALAPSGTTAGMAASTRQSRTAQELQQHGLELVLQMMGGEQHFPGLQRPRQSAYRQPRASASSEAPRGRRARTVSTSRGTSSACAVERQCAAHAAEFA